MVLPGKLDTVKKIIQKFKENNVKFIVRKIDPPFLDIDTKIQKGDNAKIEQAEKTFIQDKTEHYTQKTETIDERHNLYYSKEELEFMAEYKNEQQWKNIKLHTPSETLELNTDELKAKNLNSWKGWHCYIGIDSLYVEYNGTLFRGNCMLGPSLGKIGEKINWPSTPIVCSIKKCWCNGDMIVRKIKDVKYKNIIDD